MEQMHGSIPCQEINWWMFCLWLKCWTPLISNPSSRNFDGMFLYHVAHLNFSCQCDALWEILPSSKAECFCFYFHSCGNERKRILPWHHWQNSATTWAACSIKILVLLFLHLGMIRVLFLLWTHTFFMFSGYFVAWFLCLHKIFFFPMCTMPLLSP